jgi:hypothetical protein
VLFNPKSAIQNPKSAKFDKISIMRTSSDLQNLCQQGQELLMETDYLSAERVLTRAERIAWDTKDWDALARLYMPLQEARRQKRQRCGEGIIRLDLWGHDLSAEQLLGRYPHGQLLVAGKGSLSPAIEVRRLAAERNLYLETFLAAVYEIGGSRAIVVVGLEESRLPAPEKIARIDQLIHQVPPHSLIFTESELADSTGWTYPHVMAIWERLHRPWLAAADAEVDPVRRMAAYRQAIRVDNACEPAHQKLADTAMRMEHKQS